MRQSLELKLGQRLTMTPQLQQAIKLLQLSAIDLSTEIQQALEENPLLEEQETESDAELYAAPVEQDYADLRTLETDSGPDDSKFAANDNGGSAEENDIAQWGEHFESHITGLRNDGAGLDIEDRSTKPTTLKDHLLWQMCMTHFSETDREIAISLIDAIDEDGYLTASIDDLVGMLAKEGLQVDAEEIEATLHQIQNFDPPGVGARDLQEGLLIQLRQFDQDLPETNRATKLIENHFDLLSNRDLPRIKRLMKLSDESFNQVIKLIQNLYPRPGNVIASSQTGYIVPDVIVKKLKGEWRAELNREALPHLGINHAYQAMLNQEKSSEDKKYIQNHLQDARWFIKSLDQRNDTLLRVARAILERQTAFFEHGEEAMRPMVLHDIAAGLELHESTISRATTQKYMLTPRGIFELKFFFSSHVSTSDGGTCSSTAIRTLIKQFVEQESPAKPISDSKIAKMLGQRGINVARRTIAKYRDNLNIPASSQRKTII